MAVSERAPRIAPVPRRRAPPGRMPAPHGTEGGQPTTATGATSSSDGRAVAHFRIQAGILPTHLAGTEVLPMPLPRADMTPQDVTTIWEQEWGVTYASRVKFHIMDEMGKALFLKPRLDTVPLAPVVVQLEAVGSILTALASAFAQRMKNNSKQAQEDEAEENIIGRLSAEDLAQLKENLLRVAKQEEQQAAESGRRLQELRWQQAKSRQSLMAKRVAFEQQEQEDEEYEKEWRRMEEEYARRQVDRQQRLEREGREEMLAEKLMREDEDADHERQKLEVLKRREEREARRVAWETTQAEFQREEEQCRKQLPSEQVTLSERLLRETAAQT